MEVLPHPSARQIQRFACEVHHLRGILAGNGTLLFDGRSATRPGVVRVPLDMPPVDEREGHRGRHEGQMDDHPPEHTLIGERLARCGLVSSGVVQFDEGPEDVDRRDADYGHCKLHLERIATPVGEPIGTIVMSVEVDPGNERGVTAHDEHDQQVRDHDEVDEAENCQHDRSFVDRDAFPAGERGPNIVGYDFSDMKQLDREDDDDDHERDDQAEVQRCLEPARQEHRSSQGRAE
jgi:hypothetical protein